MDDADNFIKKTYEHGRKMIISYPLFKKIVEDGSNYFPREFQQGMIIRWERIDGIIWECCERNTKENDNDRYIPVLDIVGELNNIRREIDIRCIPHNKSHRWRFRMWTHIFKQPSKSLYIRTRDRKEDHQPKYFKEYKECLDNARQEINIFTIKATVGAL